MQFAQLGISSSFVKRGGPRVSSMTVENVTPNLITIQLAGGTELYDQVPDNLQWTIEGTTNNAIVTSTLVDGPNRIIELFLSANILDLDVVLVTYDNPGDGTGIKDIGNNFMSSFVDFSVTNNTGVLPVFAGNNNLLWLFTSTGITGSTIEDRSGLNNDGAFVKSHCATFTTSTVLTCTTSLSGITVTSNAGTATIAISGNTITCSSGGTVYNVLLSNGSIIPFANGAATIVATDISTTLLVFNVTGGTIDWTATQNTYHYNITKGFSHLGRMSAANQYVALTTGIAFSTTKFSIKFIYAPDNIATGQDLAGTATTNSQFAMGTSAGNINGTLRIGSGTTYVLSCASSAATIGYANNTFSTLILSRDPLGLVTCTLNGFTLLIDGASSVTDAGAMTISQLCRTSTANSNIGILKEVEILDAAVSTLIGTKYNAENSFLGTLTGGFSLVKYARPQGGDSVNRNTSGNWHNGCETVVKPNPAGDSAIQTATGWTNSTELTYAQLSTVSDPAFCNVVDPIRKRNLVVWTTALPYTDELVANNFVGKTTINIQKVTGWSTANHLDLTAGSSYPATLDMTIKLVLIPSGSLYTTSQFIFGKTGAIDGNDWGFGGTSNAAGSDFYFWVRNGSNAVVKSRNITFIEKDTDICIIHAGIRSNGVGGYEIFIAKGGARENTLTAITGLTTSTSNLVIGSFSGGNAFVGGILAAAYGTSGLTDNEIEASYQQTKNNIYVQESWMTLLFGSESGNANWVDRIGGSVTLTKSGTLTSTTVNQAFNYRFRPEDYSNDGPLGSPLANNSTAIKIMVVGDSRYDPTAGGFSLEFAEELYRLVAADPDIGNAAWVGFFNRTLPGVGGTPTFYHHAISGATSSSMRSGGSGNIGAHTALAAPDGSPTVCLVFIGTNSTTSNTNLNTEIDEYPTLLHVIRSNAAAGTALRFAVMEELEHDDANRRARLQYLSYQHRSVIWPYLEDIGYNLARAQQFRYITVQGGDFVDAVHQNTQGNDKKAAKALIALKLACGYTP